MDMAVFREEIQSYFAKLNPLAERISHDVDEAKFCHYKNKEAWLALSTTEQDTILNSFFIKPEIAWKYGKHSHISNTTTSCTYDGRNLCTFMHQSVASKPLLNDENTAGYYDEHSSPFSYRTKSQLNLSVIVSQNSVASNTAVSCEPCDPPQSDIPAAPHTNLKKGEPVLVNLMDVASNLNETNCTFVKLSSQTNQNVYDDTDTGCYFLSDEKTNLLTPFGSNPISNSSSTDLYEDENEPKDFNQEENTKLLSAEVEIPKGFDFLSNW